MNPSLDRKPRPHQRNLRKHRVSKPGLCYFITTNVRGEQPLLAHAGCAQIVIDALRWLVDQGRIGLLGYVVMPDHLHFAMMLQPGQALSSVVNSLKSYTARRINELRGTHGAFWEPQYYDHVLRTPQSFTAKLNYMHANPVRQGLVEDPEEYRFSTAHPANQGDIDWDALNVLPR